MKVCVVGLWHLGTVTAACLAAGGHTVAGLDFDSSTIESLQTGLPPLFEPGLEELVKRGLSEGTLSFTTDVAQATREAELIWVAYDTPVDEEDQADVGFVLERVTKLFPHTSAGTLILISSQLPVGTTRRLEQMYASAYPQKKISFAYSPENLRLGKAIEVFTEPDRVVVGLRDSKDSSAAADRERIAELFGPFTAAIEWMSVESAEMTKHALNAFLATSVTFINEVAALCEQVGADAKEVERGLKTEARIGPKAYLGAGAAFAGGTLARDVAFLEQVGAAKNQPTHLLSAVRASNDNHRKWIHRKLEMLLGELRNRTIAVWGLTYKPGTSTLRRSSSVELCEWLHDEGARVQAHDPAIQALPDNLAQKIVLCETPVAALEDAVALVLATGWPDYKALAAEAILSAMREPVVVDPNRFLESTLGNDPRVRYTAVGRGRL
ncbi:MAG: UDP-glucose/GDP-mannose dehydrogenase family protein [Acidobacteria bacterium]|nr:MAG: UDP-glucose/GDP-mannose dehydrogenase family protein [Acidobacteriota bacterium]